ncbi:ABC transporter permease [Enterobacter roggenkampii]|uniref:ABC transporter permease n=1 Tax=Enterobacter roggenkampii TaxID=1812935 RepID=UPI0030FF123C
MSTESGLKSIRSHLFSFWHNKNIIFQMTKRDILGKYKGSAIGVLWSLINPMLMLIIYTLVFSVVFKARWGTGAVDEPKTQFAVILFNTFFYFGVFSPFAEFNFAVFKLCQKGCVSIRNITFSYCIVCSIS